MSDDLDDLLRRTMKTLDDQVPSGYFDALPERVSARLAGTGEQTMQQTSGTTNEQAPSTGVPPVATKREEDSGLHDIRNLAQSTKQRLSSRRIGTNPPISDDDVLASSSASWKNLALPQPAKMVSLPEIDELPSKQDVIARDKAAKAAAKAAAREEKAAAKLDLAAPAAPISASAVEASASAPVAFKPAFSAFADKKPASPHRNRNLALVGMGLAAAAGVTIFVVTQKSSSTASEQAPARAASESRAHGIDSKDLDRATAKLEAQHAAATAAAEDKNAEGAAGAAAPAPAPPATAPDEGATKDAAKPVAKAKAHTVVITSKTGKPDKEEPKVETPKVEAKKGKGEPGDPSFDDLLKEAGVDQKKTEKPKLDKKQLSGDDFKKGMGAIQAKAAACYKGTQGTAAVKLTIAPSGQVSKVTVGGQFAGKPEADCVVSAVKSASFPPWDGGPQSFGYPILLSE